MMITASNILVAIFSLFIFGWPVAFFLFPREEDHEKRWLIAPIIGLTLITLLLQNLIYLNIPVRESTPWLWGSAFLLWIIFFIRRPFFPSLRPTRSMVALGALALTVYGIQGFGLILAGAEIYVGRAWHDFFNYTATAQFLADFPFSLNIPDVQSQPYLYAAIIKKLDRIGPSIFQAFISVSTFSSAKTSFEPSILLGPFLTVFSIYALARSLSLSRSWSLFGAMAGGILPGLAMIHLESFFAQAFGTPYLLLWPLLLHEAFSRPTWRNLTTAALLLAGAATMYTEFYPLMLVLILVGMGGEVIRIRRFNFLPLIFFLGFMVVGISLAFNVGFFESIIQISQRVAWSDTLSGIYPWAFSTEGLNRIWLGDLAAKLTGFGRSFFHLVTFGFILGSVTGLSRCAFKRKDGLSLTLLSLALVPLFIRLLGHTHKYQFYKILLSVCPLIPLGLAAFFANWNVNFNIPRIILKIVVLLLFLSASLLGTGDMAYRSGKGRTEEKIGRGGAHKLLAPSTIQMQRQLSKLQGENILIVWKDDFFHGAYLNGWLAYFARNSRVWVTNPMISDLNLKDLRQAKWKLAEPPESGFFLTPSWFARSVGGGSIEPAIAAPPFHLFRIAGRRWVAMSDLQNPNGLERAGEEYFFWLGNQNAVLEFLAGTAGKMALQVQTFPGPSLPGRKDRVLWLGTPIGFEDKIHLEDAKEIKIFIPVSRGWNQVMMRVLDPPTEAKLPHGDPRTLLLQIRSWKIVDFKTEERLTGYGGR